MGKTHSLLPIAYIWADENERQINPGIAAPQCGNYDDKAKWAALEWVVMLNHCHVLIELFEGVALGKIVLSWKDSSTQFINEHKGRTGVRRSQGGLLIIFYSLTF